MTIDTTFLDYEARLREFIRKSPANDRTTRPPAFQENEDQFNDLAMALFALQFQNNPAYRGFCEKQKIFPAEVKHWKDIPSLSTQAFKAIELTCLPLPRRIRCFCSSGTTEQRPSRHYHNAESLAVYEASLLPWFKRHLLSDVVPPAGATRRASSLRASAKDEGGTRNGRDGSERESPSVGKPPLRMIILTPPPALVPHSSLAHMFETVRRESGSVDSVFVGQVDAAGAWTLDLTNVLNNLEATVSANRPVVLLGTAFNFVHLLEHLDAHQRSYLLPAESRAMETGGYKGQSRSVSKVELLHLITRLLGVPSSHIVSEYGMCELSSQAYDHVAGATRNVKGEPSVFHFPPWTKVRIVSPESGRAVAEGETGLIRVYDLANVRSVLAVQTEDLGLRRADGFELIGRTTSAEPRGCSLAAP